MTGYLEIILTSKTILEKCDGTNIRLKNDHIAYIPNGSLVSLNKHVYGLYSDGQT